MEGALRRCRCSIPGNLNIIREGRLKIRPLPADVRIACHCVPTQVSLRSAKTIPDDPARLTRLLFHLAFV